MQAAAARHETDQVTVEEAERELALSADSDASPSLVACWQMKLSTWDGGLPSGDLDAAASEATAPSDAASEVQGPD